jgi:hypothetical protein
MSHNDVNDDDNNNNNNNNDTTRDRRALTQSDEYLSLLSHVYDNRTNYTSDGDVSTRLRTYLQSKVEFNLHADDIDQVWFHANGNYQLLWLLFFLSLLAHLKYLHFFSNKRGCRDVDSK